MYENTIAIKNYTNPNSIIAVYLMLFSLFVKIGIFPGNIWVVDIYHGVYKKIIPIISFFPKLALLYVIFKLKSIFAATELTNLFVYFLLLQ